jgi:hypothetical protein
VFTIALVAGKKGGDQPLAVQVALLVPILAGGLGFAVSLQMRRPRCEQSWFPRGAGSCVTAQDATGRLSRVRFQARSSRMLSNRTMTIVTAVAGSSTSVVRARPTS